MTVDLEETHLPWVAEKITINNCDYSFLPESFYSGEVNRIEENMRLMAEKSKDIFLPGKCGVFLDEAHYLESISVLFLSTMETQNREVFLKKIVLPKVKNKKKLLDIGPGDGGILKILGEEFDSVSIVDNNEKIINNIATSFKNVDEIIHCDLNNLPPTRQKYDLILMSHILYYANQNILEELLVNVYNMLSVNGILVIIYSDGLGKENIASFFGGALLNLEKTICQCEQILSVKSEKYISSERFVTKDIVSMQHIANVLLQDAGCSADKTAVLEYIEQFCRSNLEYSISAYQKFFIFESKKKT